MSVDSSTAPAGSRAVPGWANRLSLVSLGVCGLTFIAGLVILGASLIEPLRSLPGVPNTSPPLGILFALAVVIILNIPLLWGSGQFWLTAWVRDAQVRARIPRMAWLCWWLGLFLLVVDLIWLVSGLALIAAGPLMVGNVLIWRAGVPRPA